MDKPNKPTEPLSDAFNVAEPITSISNIEDTFSSNTEIDNANYNSDYEFTRNSLKDTILKAEDVLDDIIQLAHQSRAARSYEVVFNGIKVIFDGNKDLLELALRHKDLTNNKSNGLPLPTTQNNLFVGSTEALNNMLETMGVTTGIRTIQGNINKDG